MMSRTMSFPLALLVVAALVLPAQAQVAPRPHGVVLSAGGVGASLSVADAGEINWFGGDRSTAPGVHLAIGYAFPVGLSVLVGGIGTGTYTDRDADDYSMAIGEFSARYAFGGERSAVRPFLEAGIGLLMLTYDDLDLELSGWHYSGGGGVSYFFLPSLAVDAAVRVGTGSITEIKSDRVTFELEDEDQPKATVAQITIGLRWYPMTRSVLARER